MKKKIFGFFVGLLVVAMLVLPMSAVYATTPIPVSGDIDATAAPSALPKEAGINTFLSWATASVWSGDISGSSAGTQTWKMNGKKTHLVVPDVEIFFASATVQSLTGTLTIRMRFLMVSPEKSHGTWRIIDAAGDLEGLHGGGEWIINYALDINRYEGNVHFDP